MEYSFSSWNEETFVLEFSDDECYDRIDQTDNYGDKERIRPDSKWCDSSTFDALDDYAKMELENYCDSKDLKVNQSQEKKRKSVLQYSAIAKHSPENPTEISTNMEQDEMVNIPKLIYQLLNATVVIEKMCESSGRNLTSETKCISRDGSQLKDSIQRYCPKCKTLEADKHNVSTRKSCLLCGTRLKYMCSKCNSQQYLSYQKLKMHWDKCELAADTWKKLHPSQLNKRSGRDLTSETECVLPNGFKLKHSIQRYCPKCKTLKKDKDGVTIKKVCPKCQTVMKYVCSKCNTKQYAEYTKLRAHWVKCTGQTADTCKNLYPSQRKVRVVSTQRYCPKCKTSAVDKHRISARKSCPKCETTLNYMCSKCNSKQYLSYAKLAMHWNKCDGSAEMKASACKKMNTTNSLVDKASAAKTRNKSNPTVFIVKKTEIDYSREIIRYCSRCNKIEENSAKWKDEVCQTCKHDLLYQCNKCKAQYDRPHTLVYHMQIKCYPSQYKCNQCDFTHPLQEKIRLHASKIHFGTKINCPRCDTVMKNEESLRYHLTHCGIEPKFNCNYCAFKTKYKYSLVSHMKNAHGK